MYYFNKTDFEQDEYYDYSSKDITTDNIKWFLKYYTQRKGLNLYEFGINNCRFDQICIDIKTNYQHITIFEFKISRNDWKNDNKWQNYLKYCNKLIFVCPYGVINKNELPKGIGLIHVYKWKYKQRVEFNNVCGNRISIARKRDMEQENYIKVLEQMIRKMPYRKDELF